MKRREFITLVGGAAAAWPLAARAETSRIAVLIPIVQPLIKRPLSAFLQQLHAFGWTEDQNIHIDYRWTGEEIGRIRSYAEEIASLNPKVILAHGGPVVAALQKATRTVPIVFVQVPDPIEAAFVNSLSHPGGNLTGFTNFEPQMGSKWLELLKEIAPNVSRGLLMQTGSFAAYFSVMKSAAEKLGLQLSAAEVRDATEIVEAIESLARDPNGGLIVAPSPVTANYRNVIIELCAKYSIPAVYPFRYFAEAGGLMAYGSDTVDMYARAASYVDRILKGANPGDLPIQQPTKFELIINRKTANSLGLDVPAGLLVSATEVIE